MTKYILLIFFNLLSINSVPQTMFGKNPYKNLQDYDDRRFDWGYYLGFSSLNFKFDYNEEFYNQNESSEILTTSSTGFNVGFVLDLRIISHLNIRFEPGFATTNRLLFYPYIIEINKNQRTVQSNYIHLPMLIKFSALRAGNIRPYILGGFSQSLNLSSNETSKEDNYQGRFRMKKWTSNYELGLGIDFYFEYFKFSPSIRGVFGLQDELIRDKNPNSIWTGNIESMKTRGIFVNFTFH